MKKLLKKYFKIVKFKYLSKYSKFKSLFVRFHEYLKLTQYHQYKQWENDDTKNLYTIFIEYLLSNFSKYIWTGLIINIMLYGYGLMNISILNMTTLAITYWLLTTLLLMFKDR